MDKQDFTILKFKMSLREGSYAVHSQYIAVSGVQAMVPRYKWERDISGVSINQRVVSDNGAFVCLAANSVHRQRIWWHLSKFDVALQNHVAEFPD